MDKSTFPERAESFFRNLNSRLVNRTFEDALPEIFVVFQDSHPDVTMHALTRLTGGVDLASRRAQAIALAIQEGEWVADGPRKASLPLPIRPASAPVKILDLEHGSAKGVAKVILAAALILDSRPVNVAANIAGLVGANAIDIVSWAEALPPGNNSPQGANAPQPPVFDALPPELIEGYNQSLGPNSSLCIAIPTASGDWYKLRMQAVNGDSYMSIVPILNDAGEEYLQKALNECETEMAAQAAEQASSRENPS